MSRCARQNIGRITRRMLLSAAGVAAAAPVLAEECQIGPSPHEKGPLVWMDYDQLELDAAYDQLQYAPLMGQNVKRQASLSEEVRGRLGQPLRRQYGQTQVEALDIYRTNRPNAPVFVFIHGGAWLVGLAKNNGFPAELFVNAGVHYVALDFIAIKEADGDLRPMADQVRRGIAWVYENAGCRRNVQMSVPSNLKMSVSPAFWRAVGGEFGDGAERERWRVAASRGVAGGRSWWAAGECCGTALGAQRAPGVAFVKSIPT
jgi:hypothetical protein